MNKKEALSTLYELLIDLQELPSFSPNGLNKEYKKWNKRTTRKIATIFGENSSNISEFIDFDFLNENGSIYDYSPRNDIKNFDETKDEAIIFFENCIEEVDEWEDTEEEKKSKNLKS